MSGFLILGLPRSRTAWLSRFLSYGDWICGHEQLRNMRSLEDVKTYFSQPCIGTAETAAAPYWRLIENIVPGCRVVIIRRPVNDVVGSLIAIPGLTFDRDILESEMRRLDRKLYQIASRMDCLTVDFDDLADEQTCAKVFEYCLPYPHDSDWWAMLSGVNIQCDMRALLRQMTAFRPQMEKLSAVAKHRILSNMALRKPVTDDAITIQTESFDDWVSGAEKLFNEHLVQVGEAPDDWQRKNIPLMRLIYDAGAMQIVTARCNGRMFGYLMTLISPSLTSESVTSGTNTTFYADPQFPGLGMKMQRAALQELKARGVGEVFWETGKRGSGPRLGTMYRRMGAVEHGETYRLDLKEVA